MFIDDIDSLNWVPADILVIKKLKTREENYI
ncbi:hypothetical protein BCD95_002837 [Clostridium beijerinckii]|uniref:Uncharacterized protein n=1 Tax=Clostridium beijerinckii TaxID=1520 RepID=A0AAE5H5E8_CLOBE|nr:hypothetical protein [Clostridium beijerinckii]